MNSQHWKFDSKWYLICMQLALFRKSGCLHFHPLWLRSLLKPFFAFYDYFPGDWIDTAFFSFVSNYACIQIYGYFEIGLPPIAYSLTCPISSQGNIATWKKKEGDEVAAGDVLCEIETVGLVVTSLRACSWFRIYLSHLGCVHDNSYLSICSLASFWMSWRSYCDGYYILENLCKQDKATLEMESMEDGFLGKILVGDGAKDIPVGQVYHSSSGNRMLLHFCSWTLEDGCHLSFL